MKIYKSTMILGCLAALAGCANQQTKPTQTPASATASNSTNTQAAGAGQSSGMNGQSMALSSFPHLVHFRTNSAFINRANRKIVKENAAYMLANPTVRVRLEGNTDERGTAQYNMALGQRRADAVKHLMEVLGVPASHMATISFGKSRPIAMGHNPQAWAINRRVHFNYKYFASK